MKHFKNAVKFGAAIAGSLVAASAHAAIDTTGVTDALTAAGTAVGVIGGAVLVAYVGVKAFSLAKAALGR